MTKTFRAAYADWDNNGVGMLLTSPEMADWADDALIAEALAYADRHGLDISGAEIVVGDWIDRY